MQAENSMEETAMHGIINALEQFNFDAAVGEMEEEELSHAMDSNPTLHEDDPVLAIVVDQCEPRLGVPETNISPEHPNFAEATSSHSAPTKLSDGKRSCRIRQNGPSGPEPIAQHRSVTLGMALSSKYDHLSSSSRRSRIRRNKKRSDDDSGIKSVSSKRVAMSGTIPVGLDSAQDFSVTSPAWEGIESDDLPWKDPYYLPELIQMGMKLVEWDGISPQVIKDRIGRAVAVLLGRPRGERFMEEVITPLWQGMYQTREKLTLPEKNRKHRRGNFDAISAGFSMGPGSLEPGNLSIPNEKQNESPVKSLLEEGFVKRLVGFTNRGFRSYSPRLYQYYRTTMNKLRESNPDLQPITEETVFAACTVNLGPQVRTKVHKDVKNLPWGWCAVTALGPFNPDEGGHLILWDFGLVIRFPPGATILLPSAVVYHSNVPIPPGQERGSFTQYSAGSLFRWVDYGFKLATEHVREVGKKAVLEQNKARWVKGVGMFSNVSDLK